jgi:hypothetical protein
VIQGLREAQAMEKEAFLQQIRELQDYVSAQNIKLDKLEE